MSPLASAAARIAHSVRVEVGGHLVVLDLAEARELHRALGDALDSLGAQCGPRCETLVLGGWDVRPDDLPLGMRRKVAP